MSLLFLLWFVLFALFKKYLPNLWSERFSLVFSCRSYIVLGFGFRFIISFKLVFSLQIHCKCQGSLFCILISKWSKDCSFPVVLPWELCGIYVYLFLNSMLYHTLLNYYSFQVRIIITQCECFRFVLHFQTVLVI